MTLDGEARRGRDAARERARGVGAWVSPDAIPRNDALDKVILGLFVPAVLNFLIIPLVGAVDVFWVGRLGGRRVALARAGGESSVSERVLDNIFHSERRRPGRGQGGGGGRR